MSSKLTQATIQITFLYVMDIYQPVFCKLHFTETTLFKPHSLTLWWQQTLVSTQFWFYRISPLYLTLLITNKLKNFFDITGDVLKTKLLGVTILFLIIYADDIRLYCYFRVSDSLTAIKLFCSIEPQKFGMLHWPLTITPSSWFRFYHLRNILKFILIWIFAMSFLLVSTNQLWIASRLCRKLQ